MVKRGNAKPKKDRSTVFAASTDAEKMVCIGSVSTVLDMEQIERR